MRAHSVLTSFTEERCRCQQHNVRLKKKCNTHDAENSYQCRIFGKISCLSELPLVLPPPTHPPPALPCSLIRMQKASSMIFLSLAGSAFLFSNPWPISNLLSSRLTLRHIHKCQQEIKSIMFYFLINLSSWQVQHKITKPSGRKITFQTFETGKSSSVVVAGSQEPQHLYINVWLPAEVPLLNNKKLMRSHIWWTMLMFGFPAKRKAIMKKW